MIKLFEEFLNESNNVFKILNLINKTRHDDVNRDIAYKLIQSQNIDIEDLVKKWIEPSRAIMPNPIQWKKHPGKTRGFNIDYTFYSEPGKYFYRDFGSHGLGKDFNANSTLSFKLMNDGRYINESSFELYGYNSDTGKGVDYMEWDANEKSYKTEKGIIKATQKKINEYNKLLFGPFYQDLVLMIKTKIK